MKESTERALEKVIQYGAAFSEVSSSVWKPVRLDAFLGE
jgi:hypothetical protein